MPEGLDGLGAAGLRDVIAYMRASAATPAAATAPVTVAPAASDPTPKTGGRNDAPLPELARDAVELLRYEAEKSGVTLSTARKPSECPRRKAARVFSGAREPPPR